MDPNVPLFLFKTKCLIAGIEAQQKPAVGWMQFCWMDAVSPASILVAALIVCNAAAASLELLCEGLKRGGADRAFKELFKSLRIFDDVQCLTDSFGARPVHDFQVALYSRPECA